MYVEDKQKWEVNRILRYKGSGRRSKYLVAYSEYNEFEACWLPESKFTMITTYNALEVLNDYRVSRGLT